MATVQVAFYAPHNIGGTSVYPKRPRLAETKTSSGTSSPTTAVALAGEFAIVSAVGGAVYAAGIGTVAAASGYLIQDGASRDIGPLAAGDVISILDVT